MPYLNEFMAADGAAERLATYRHHRDWTRMGLPLAVKDAAATGREVWLAVDAADLPLSSSAVDPVGLAEVEQSWSWTSSRTSRPRCCTARAARGRRARIMRF